MVLALQKTTRIFLCSVAFSLHGTGWPHSQQGEVTLVGWGTTTPQNAALKAPQLPAQACQTDCNGNNKSCATMVTLALRSDASMALGSTCICVHHIVLWFANKVSVSWDFFHFSLFRYSRRSQGHNKLANVGFSLNKVPKLAQPSYSCRGLKPWQATIVPSAWKP